MPPKKVQKTTNLEASLAAFCDQARTEFQRHAKNGRIKKLKCRQILTVLGLDFDDTLLTEEQLSDGLDEQAFVLLVEQTKRESDLSGLVDYIYDYLCYQINPDDDTIDRPGSTKDNQKESKITFTSYFKALKTLNKIPKRQSTWEKAYLYANPAHTFEANITRSDLVRLMRHVGFFTKHYKEFNLCKTNSNSNSNCNKS